MVKKEWITSEGFSPFWATNFYSHSDAGNLAKKPVAVKAGESEPNWTGAILGQIDDNALNALESY